MKRIPRGTSGWVDVRLGRCLALLGCAGLFGIANMPSAEAAEPDHFALSFANSDVLDCGGFQDHYTDFFDASGVVFSNSAGEEIRMVIHWAHRSNDTNSVTGLTLHEHGHFTETIDLETGTDTITGNEEIATLPGTGVVVQDVGRVVTDENGDLVFFAGGRNHSEILFGNAVLCAALS